MDNTRLCRCGTRRGGSGATDPSVISVFAFGDILLCQKLRAPSHMVKGKGMTAATKLRIMITVTALMGIGFTIMMIKGIYVPCIILGCVWVAHIIYFTFGVKTLKE